MQNTLIDGRYKLQSELGSGGEARVFRATDENTGAFVAVRLSLRPGVVITASHPDFSHDAWVQFLDSGSDEQYGAYQVFELLEGHTLRELIVAGPFHPAEWREFVDQSLAAVEAVHQTGCPHGDLNADNFLRTQSSWKLLELPFLRSDPPANRSAVFGSIHTLAPEQIDGAKPSVQTDIYSLGCLYYFASSGVYPHPGTNSAEVAISSLRFAPIPLREKAATLPESSSDWVMKLIAPKPGDRPPSIAAARQLLGVGVA